jgi:phosphatidylserine decarboxylase
MNDHFTSTQIIAKEGWLNIGVAFIIFLLACLFDFGSHFMLFVLLFLTFIYRNPERIAYEDDPLAILAPIDGKITAIDKDENLIENQSFLRIKIRSLFFDVSMARFPIDAFLSNAKTTHGLFLTPNTKTAERLNEQIELKCAHKNLPFYMRITAGSFSKKISLGKERGNIKSGARIAFMVDGTVELFLPLNSRIKLSIGDNVKGGESVIGYLAYKEQ